MRLAQQSAASGQVEFAQELLVGFGILSMAWAMVFLVRQMDFKRMLAYSSVEHMGILVFGIGIGGAAARFALFHLAAALRMWNRNKFSILDPFPNASGAANHDDVLVRVRVGTRHEPVEHGNARGSQLPFVCYGIDR